VRPEDHALIGRSFPDLARRHSTYTLQRAFDLSVINRDRFQDGSFLGYAELMELHRAVPFEMVLHHAGNQVPTPSEALFTAAATKRLSF